jgi:hypothetical protein
MFSADSFTESWLYKEGEAAGRAKVEAKGEAKGKREFLLLALNHKFPALESPPEISQIDSSEELDQLLVAILKAQNADEARAAIRAALR